MISVSRVSSRATWLLMLAAAAILMITMGVRQTTGLFLSPIGVSTGLGVASISFAFAIGQFVWGAAQPIFGAISDKYGPFLVITAGSLLMAAGLAATTMVESQNGLLLTQGLMVAAGAGAGSFSILIGAAAQHLPEEKRSFAAGFINAGGSAGQFVFAPVVQIMIAATGWVAAMLTLAVSTLITIPFAWTLRNRKSALPAPNSAAPVAAPSIGMGRQIREAYRDPSWTPALTDDFGLHGISRRDLTVYGSDRRVFCWF